MACLPFPAILTDYTCKRLAGEVDLTLARFLELGSWLPADTCDSAPFAGFK